MPIIQQLRRTDRLHLGRIQLRIPHRKLEMAGDPNPRSLLASIRLPNADPRGGDASSHRFPLHYLIFIGQFPKQIRQSYRLLNL